MGDKKYKKAAVNTENKPFPVKLRKLLSENNCKQSDLAKRLNVTPETISNYCLGKSAPTIYKLKEIAGFFRVTTDYLLFEGDEYPYEALFYIANDFKEACHKRSGEALYRIALKVLDLTPTGRELLEQYLDTLLNVHELNEAYQIYIANSRDYD